jgi:hypothetical protein
MSVYLTGVHLMGVYLTGVHLIMCLIGVYLMGMHPSIEDTKHRMVLVPDLVES